MKQLSTMKSLFCTMLAVAAATFAACVDDNVDEQAPSLELSETTIAFSGTATEDATVTVKSNRQWSIAYEDDQTREWMYFKVTGNEVSPGVYFGDGTVKITVGESTEPQMGRLIFTLSNSYGELYRKYLTVTQGDYVPPTQGPVGDLVEYILGNAKFSGATGTDKGRCCCQTIASESAASVRQKWCTKCGVAIGSALSLQRKESLSGLSAQSASGGTSSTRRLPARSVPLSAAKAETSNPARASKTA